MRRKTHFLLLLLLTLAIGGTGTDASTGDDDEKLCPVHHVPLQRENLEIVYGLIADSCYTLDRAKAAEKNFPYANSVVYGGCLIRPGAPKFQEVLYCSKCRAVERTWPCLETRETPIVTELPPPRITKLPTVN